MGQPRHTFGLEMFCLIPLCVTFLLNTTPSTYCELRRFPPGMASFLIFTYALRSMRSEDADVEADGCTLSLSNIRLHMDRTTGIHPGSRPSLST